MENLDHIKAQIKDSIDTKIAVLELLATKIAFGGQIISNALSNGHKVLCCGNGGSAADAQHFAAELLGRFVKERAGLPAIALTTDTSTLTAIANDYGYDQVFSRQVQAQGKPGDVLLVITTSGNSENLLKAVEAAHSKNMHVIALTGKGGGKITKLLREGDMEICVPSDTTSRIQESHILVIHCFCEIVDLL